MMQLEIGFLMSAEKKEQQKIYFPDCRVRGLQQLKKGGGAHPFSFIKMVCVLSIFALPYFMFISPFTSCFDPSDHFLLLTDISFTWIPECYLLFVSSSPVCCPS